MKIIDYLKDDLILLNLESRERQPLFLEMTRMLQERGHVKDGLHAAEALQKRERLGSTGMNGGFALPHAYLDTATHSLLSIGVSRQGVDFHTLDNEPVHIIFLLLGSPSQKAIHIRLLARLSRLMRNSGLRERLLAAQSPAEIVRMVSEGDIS